MNGPSLDGLPPRQRSWNLALGAHPGDLDLEIPPHLIEGALPGALRGGRLLSVGPGWNVMGGRHVHPFDGHGYVRAFHLLDNGGVALRARFVRTPVYEDERQQGVLIHRGLATNPHDRSWRNARPGIPRNVANTTVSRVGDTILAGWEGGTPWALDATTLETRGEATFGGVLAGQITLAHMKMAPPRGVTSTAIDTATRHLVTCSLRRGRATTYTFRAFDVDGRVVEETTARVPGLSFTHDFAVTPTHFILGGNPLVVKWPALGRTLMGSGTLLSALRPDDDAGGSLILIDRLTGAVTRVALPGPTFVVHFGNAHLATDGATVVDVCAFSRFTLGEEFGYAGRDAPFDVGLPERRGPQQVMRVVIPPGAAEGRWQRLTEHGVDFPRFHPHHEGRPTPRLYGATRKDTRFSDPFDAVIAIDLDDLDRDDALWSLDDDTRFVGEPVFVPDADDPARGHLLCLVSDALRARTTLVVLDAAALARGPIACVHLPLLPVAFHGEWDPDGRGLTKP